MTYDAPENPYWVSRIQHQDIEIPLSPVPLADYLYTYDNVGNRESMTDGMSGDVLDYTYDNAYRLISESRNEAPVASYSYSAAGNRLTEYRAGQGTSRYIYNANDQLQDVYLNNRLQQHYGYDDRGNVTSSLTSTGELLIYASGNYSYDSRNQLTAVNGNISYSYDHAGRRIQQNIAGNITNYLWDEYSQYGDVILESNASYQYERHYTLANGQLLAQTDSLGSLYFLSDAQGSTRALTNASGAVTSQFSYDAFGNLDENIAPTTVATRYLYTGQQFDPYTELYSLRARYYDPSVGRFTSRDTWAYDYQNPMELNRYVYVSNNPVRHTDPSGNALLERAQIDTNISQGSSFSIGRLTNSIVWNLLFAMIGHVVGSGVVAVAFEVIDILRGEEFSDVSLGTYFQDTVTNSAALLSNLVLGIQLGVANYFTELSVLKNMGQAVTKVSQQTRHLWRFRLDKLIRTVQNAHFWMAFVQAGANGIGTQLFDIMTQKDKDDAIALMARAAAVLSSAFLNAFFNIGASDGLFYTIDRLNIVQALVDKVPILRGFTDNFTNALKGGFANTITVFMPTLVQEIVDGPDI